MKYLKKKNKRNPIGWILLVMVLMIAAFAGGILVGPVLRENTAPPETTLQPQETEPAIETTLPQNTEPVETIAPDAETYHSDYLAYELRDGDIVAPTPFGDVCYTAEFMEFIQVTHEFTQEQYMVHFDAVLDTGVRSRVFSVCFAEDTGHQPEGILIGSVPAENGTERLVIVVVNDLFPDPSWDEDMRNLAYAMQENISATMDQLSHLDGIQ